jgi:hypothetical protein
MKKIVRRMIGIARDRGFDIEVSHTGTSHYRLKVKRDGQSRTFTASASPKNEDIAVRSFDRDLRRYFR